TDAINPNYIQPGKAIKNLEQEIRDLRSTKRLGCNHIRLGMKESEENIIHYQNNIQNSQKTCNEHHEI
ncbi:MAG: hypothetical protein ACRD8K_08790, partial [Nitrososphaeraceae archaeon]